LKRDAIQALSEASETAVGNVAKHARSFLQLLPQSCRELVDAERAFAVVRLREDESPPISPFSSPQLGPAKAPSLSSVLGALPGTSMSSSGTGMAHGYVTCCNVKSGGMGVGRLEVLVATRRGCAYVYDWGPNCGGEGRLRSEHSIAPENLEELQRTPTPRSHRRAPVPTTAMPPKERVEMPGTTAPASKEQVEPATKGLIKAQLGA